MKIGHGTTVRRHRTQGHVVYCRCGWKEYAYPEEAAYRKALAHMEALILV